jgi:hypothetical protein
MTKGTVLIPFKHFEVGSTMTAPKALMVELQNEGFIKILESETEIISETEIKKKRNKK